MSRTFLTWALLALLGSALPLAGAAQPKGTSPASQMPSSPAVDSPTQAAPSVGLFADLGIQPPQPYPLVAGHPAILPFKLSRNVPVTSGKTSRPDLRLTIDGSVVPTNVVIRDNGGWVTGLGGDGNLVFSVPRSVLQPTFLGIYIGGTHLLAVTDLESGASDASTVEVVEATQFWVLVSLLASIALAAIYAVWVFWQRVYRQRLLRTYPTSLSRMEASRSVPDSSAKQAGGQPVSVPDSLVSAFAEGSAVLVTGPYLSAHAGVPVGTDLLKMLLARLGDDVPAALLGADLTRLIDRAGHIDLAMDTLLASVDRTRVIDALAAVQRAVPADISVLQRLLELPWRGLMSLTSDGLVDRALEGRPGWNVLSLDQRQDISAALRDARMRYAVVPFGNVAKPSSVSLTLQELRRRLSQAPETQRALSLMLQTQNFCFVGVPAEALMVLLPLLSPDQPSGVQRHYALVSGEGAGVWAAALSRFGVQVVDYDSYAHGGFDDFFTPLTTILRNRGVRHAPASRRLENLQVARLKLTNIGPFDELQVLFNTIPVPEEPSPTSELPWTVIFGLNGCGKSTVLRAIAVALAGMKGEFAASRMLRAGRDSGAIELEMKGGSEPVTMQTLIYRDQSRVTVSCTATSPVEAGICLVLGFPSLRGAPSPNPGSVEVEPKPSSEVGDLLPLANGAVDHRMANFKQFLVNTLVDASNPKNIRACAIKTLLDEIVREIVPGDIQSLVPITGAPYEIKVNTPGGQVPFDEMSQGMASVFNWIGVLLQRLYDIYPTDGGVKPEARHAVLIIDEIDAHLHPDWQRRLVSLTKKQFPRIQVIATAHSPLLAGSLRRNETIVAKRDGENGAVTMRAIAEDLYGKTSQDILTGPAFSLVSDRNAVVEAKILEYVDLRARPNLTDADFGRLQSLRDDVRPLEFAATGMKPTTFEPPTADEIAALQDMLSRVKQATAPNEASV